MTGEKFTKKEIVDVIYENTGMSKTDIKFVFDAVFNTIKDALIGGFSVELRGFGVFEVKIRKARSNARNPRTGESVLGHPHGIVDFKPGKELKQEVWPLREKQKAEFFRTTGQHPLDPTNESPLPMPSLPSSSSSLPLPSALTSSLPLSSFSSSPLPPIETHETIKNQETGISARS
jgi:integration host factor subunit beta